MKSPNLVIGDLPAGTSLQGGIPMALARKKKKTKTSFSFGFPATPQKLKQNQLFPREGSWGTVSFIRALLESLMFCLSIFIAVWLWAIPHPLCLGFSKLAPATASKLTVKGCSVGSTEWGSPLERQNLSFPYPAFQLWQNIHDIKFTI